MKRVLLLSVAALAACATRQPGDDVYRAQGAATITSLDCSRRALSGMGYQVIGSGGGSTGELRGERTFDEGVEPSRGYLTVSVPIDPGTVMYVTAERVASTRLPLPGRPGARPNPTPTPVPAVRRTPERLSPGPVAADARNVVRRCGMAGSVTEA
ncbi:MAG: hypothetical protein ACJ8J0_03710 [Longimicrobiaceae bacterium]